MVVKKALLVGCNYPGTNAALNGCINDCHGMRDVLVKRFGFPPDNIRMLLDTDPATPPPTGKNIKAALQDLVAGAEPGDILFFHYSGHGTQVPQATPDGTEADGKDEAIVPTDMNLIIDDDLKAIISTLPPGVKFTMISDCCHSGGLLDGQTIVITGEKDPNKKSAPEGGLDVSALVSMGSALLAGAAGGAGGGGGGGGGGLDLSKIMSMVQGAVGKREFDASNVSVKNRELPIKDVAKILGQKAGQDVSLANLHTQLGSLFGKDASNVVKNFMSALEAGGGEGKRAAGDAGSSAGGGRGGLMTMVTALLKTCLQPQTSGKPDVAWKPVPGTTVAPDRAVLITGCESYQTSADACPTGDKSKAFGALSNAIQTILSQESDKALTNKEIVLAVREYLIKGGFEQNPNLECDESRADEPFLG